MARSYPLNRELPLERYEHRALGARDMMVNRIMETYMFPQKVKTETLHGLAAQVLSFGPIKGQDREAGLDIQCVSKMLLTESDAVAPWIIWGQSIKDTWKDENARWRLPPPRYPAVPRVGDMMLDLVQRHYLEVISPSLRLFLRHLKHYHMHPPSDPGRGWKHDMIQHLKSHQRQAMVHQSYSLFSGTSGAPPDDTKFLSDGFIISLSQKRLFTHVGKLKWARHTGIPREQEYPLEWKYELHDIPCLAHGRAPRSNSQPAPGSWASSDILGPNPVTVQWHYWVIHFPVRRLSELDKLSRRRSLSQTHIRNMFRGASRSSSRSRRTQKAQAHPCTNCGLFNHTSRKCETPCGHCGKGTHQAPRCPVQASNRCKCRPFPCHVAVNCTVRCSRRCGNPFPPSHNKHVNAMTCTHRCCMCGVHGHTGRQCTFRRCPCGQQHLTQGCRWKVECPRTGCDRYLCRLHCAGCGKKRGIRSEFVGGRCSECLADELPVRPRAD